jgi:hypothetical protein
MLVWLRCTRQVSAVEEKYTLEGLADQAAVEHISVGYGQFLGLELASDDQQVILEDVEFIKKQSMPLPQVLNQQFGAVL